MALAVGLGVVGVGGITVVVVVGWAKIVTDIVEYRGAEVVGRLIFLKVVAPCQQRMACQETPKIPRDSVRDLVVAVVVKRTLMCILGVLAHPLATLVELS